VKVSCKNPSQIQGASEVFINKKGRRISWFYLDKLRKYTPSKPDDDLENLDDDDIIDEEDPESQESHGWLETIKPSTEPSCHPGGSSDYQGRKACDSSKAIEVQNPAVMGSDLMIELQNLALKLNPQLEKISKLCHQQR